MILALSLSMPLLLMYGCLTRKEVEVEFWSQSGLPKELCDSHPELAHYGIYRTLDSGKFEFLSYCTEIQNEKGEMISAVQGYTSVNTKKLKAILDALLPNQSGGQ